MKLLCESATVGFPGGGTGVSDLTWAAAAGECWAVVGTVGSGKTALLRGLAGLAPVVAGRIDRESRGVEYVSFREQSRKFSADFAYYQQRFDFADAEEPLSLRTFLGDAAVNVPESFRLEHLLSQPFVTLSNGETRRARLAKAVAAGPEILLLDDPFLGLDVEARGELGRVLFALSDAGTLIVLACRAFEIPAAVTHVLRLDGGQVMFAGPAAEFPRPPIETPRRACATAPTHEVPTDPSLAPETEVVTLNNVSIGYGSKRVLTNVNWAVRGGERWAVLGPNGSGKSTLLSLLCGDHPQAYANDVRLFGRRRGTGESIWDVKQKIGLLSPELHTYFPTGLTAAAAVSTGFTDTMTPTADRGDDIRDVLNRLGIAALAGRRFGSLSTGEQRLVLLGRAVVKRPPLLILDEPFQALDDASLVRVRGWLAEELTPDQTLLFVSHHMHDIPDGVTRTLVLGSGTAVVA